ncbi:MAG: pectate lyase [Bacteroides sp.]|nr:pectate lyase [Bacteroides sp.]
MKIIRSLMASSAILLTASLAGAMEITRTDGWFETAIVQWKDVAGTKLYEVYIDGEGLDNVKADDELIRLYPAYWRVDIPGLKAGTYTVTVKALDGSGDTIDSATTESITVKPYIREGFAFRDAVPGAYNMDGTPKEDARVLYITPDNVNTVEMSTITSDKGKESTANGLSAILKNYNKGYDKRPLIIRFIGCIRNVDGLKGGNALEFTGANFDKRATENVTLEGIGDDATAYGFGFYTKRCRGIEIRNVGVMLFPDDGISVENDNRNLWFHHCDFFYGMPGKDADQSKGDGTIDMKYNSSDITVDHNHFFDSGKCTFAGGATEDGAIYFTYHHIWFDHADSRCPRLCHATTHIYNNYFDANATMCLLSTENTSAFVEANYYRNCPSPMEINMQGTNKKRWPDGTQDGGMNKGYNNLYEGSYELITQHDNPTDFDVYVVADRDEQIPSTVASLKGGNTYDNFDTAPEMYSYAADDPADVPSKVMAEAGRCDGGDFKWVFNHSSDDTNTSVDPDLKAALQNYDSSLVAIGGSSAANHTTAIFTPADETLPASQQFYDLTGRSLTSTSDLPAGVYIVRSGDTTKKILVK